MIPSAFDEENGLLSPPAGVSEADVTSLSVHFGNIREPNGELTPVVVSCWKPTKEELDEINKTGRVWLIVYGQTMPPAAIGGFNPWRQT